MTDSPSDFFNHEPAARKALVQLGYDADACDISWLSGGGAHKNFLVRSEGRETVLKVWNTMWEAVGVLPPSAVIMHNTQCASDLGIGATVLGTTNDPTALLLDYIPNAKILSADDPQWTGKLASTARSLHDSDARFARDFSAFGEARTMLAAARNRGARMPDNFTELATELDRIERVLDLRFNEFVPCHNDLYGPNVLQTTDGSVKLIDYDLSGNGDRCYDLGFAAAYFEMDEDTIHRFCEEYFGSHDEHLVARVRLFSAAADWNAMSLWLVAGSMADTNDDYDYDGELANSMRRLDQTLGSAWFGSVMDAARR